MCSGIEFGFEIFSFEKYRIVCGRKRGSLLVFVNSNSSSCLGFFFLFLMFIFLVFASVFYFTLLSITIQILFLPL